MDLEAPRLQLEAKIAGVERKISESTANILEWMFATIGFQTFVIIGAWFVLLKPFIK